MPQMSEMINLSRQIEKQLPAELVGFMQTAGKIAAGQGQKLYLVGGVVRDLLLERGNLDIDLVLEDDALILARRLAEITGGKMTVHRRFGTAKLRWNRWSVDLITARSETYARPGALPTIKPGSLADDLFRRDFTINAMAVELIPDNYGGLVDLYHGREDLEHKLIRTLHEKSFIDDATRIWRGLRYEQRLDFQLEPGTLKLLKRDINMLDTISSDRIRHELELVLKEKFPEKALKRADELGVLFRLHPALKGDRWLAEKFKEARQVSSPNPPSVELYMALLAYRLSGEETESLISQLRPQKTVTRTLRDTSRLKTNLSSLADPELAPSRIFRLLKDYSLTAITANSVASDSSVVQEHIKTFLTRLRSIKPSLTGNDLQKMGIPPGPRIKEILERLHEVRLDGKVKTKREEVEMVRGWVNSPFPTPPA